MERRSIAIRGMVQGVGFRPFVYGLARRLDLGGSVRNTAGDVRIEVEGDAPQLDEFLDRLGRDPPPLARIDELSWEWRPVRGERGFHIESSERGVGGPVAVSPDVATCDECLAELFDPADRRYRYPFLNCTNCGPRLTIVTGAPYDRERTTMAGFVMCRACRAEYEDPTNRRFHAQPTACPVCGPRLKLLDAAGGAVRCDDPLAALVEAMRAGRIGAIKGLGGYHLACDARHETAVAELRRRKHRDEKPFAIMVRHVDAAAELCEVSDAERQLLASAARPIVLLRRRTGCGVAGAVAPGNPLLGVMLPYTPLHHLLMHDLGGVPLVMTSGNRSDEPTAHEDGDALERLAGIADLFLVHDRPIRARCDDSVTRVVLGGESLVRRSRGHAPRPLAMPVACERCVLAVGGQQKTTFALGRGRQAILSHHAGDLDDYGAYRAFERDVRLYEQLFAVRPAVIAHDLHPDYASTGYAIRRAAEEGMELVGVQHHHAHLASCMAEHGLSGPVIGVTFDGTGYGTDGRIWGGEFLVGDFGSFHRAAHLRYVAMPGGDRAVREPWRMALAHLLDAGRGGGPIEGRVTGVALRTAGRMIERRFNSPETSSAGRLFDAVACLAGVRDRVSYEGQAAIELEWLAHESEVDGVYPFELADTAEGGGAQRTWEVDTRPLVGAVVDDVRRGVAAAAVARRFHGTMVEVVVRVCGLIRRGTGLGRVVLSGGVFMNVLLTEGAARRLEEEGFEVYRHRLVPPNDGGLSLGQLAAAAARTGGQGAEGSSDKGPVGRCFGGPHNGTLNTMVGDGGGGGLPGGWAGGARAPGSRGA